jgi:hypothetical protein
VPYAAVVAAAFVAFVRWYEEPTLAWQFGSLPGLPGGRARLVARRHPLRPAGDD